jgi:hypothetical protein
MLSFTVMTWISELWLVAGLIAVSAAFAAVWLARSDWEDIS